MATTIVELLRVHRSRRDAAWLRAALQAAVCLEFATIPPYLCAMWSIRHPLDESDGKPAYDRLQGIVREEMLHMGLAANMLTSIGGTPVFNTPDAVPQYPGRLPRHVHPELTVYLSGLTLGMARDVFMALEHPAFRPPALAEDGTAEAYPTIGAFYQAIEEAFTSSVTCSGQRQLDLYFAGSAKICSVDDARRAIRTIKEQGEGTSTDPELPDFGHEFAHYYRLKEIYMGRQLCQGPGGAWVFEGDVVPFPTVYPMAIVPPGGYAEDPNAPRGLLHQFNSTFTQLVDDLQDAWANGNQISLDNARSRMNCLEEPARALMQVPRRDGLSTYGPDFQLLRASYYGSK